MMRGSCWSPPPIFRGTVPLCATLLCLAGQPWLQCEATEPTFTWSTSLGAASLGNSLDEQPLLVIDLSGEVTAEPFTSPLGRLLSATTFSDPRIVDLSRRRFKVVCRQHGATPLVLRHTPKHEKIDPADLEKADNVVFYFCTPDARVLHMAVGFLPADELLAAAALAERLLRATQLERDAATQKQAVRAWHANSVTGQQLVAFRRHLKLRHSQNEAARDGDFVHVQDVVAAAAEVHSQELRARLGAQWTGAVLDEAVRRLSHHGEVATSFPHLVLSEIPLVKLDALDCICYEAVTGQPCLSITARRKALYGWFIHARRQRQPVMLVVDDRPFAAPPVNELADLLIWEPRNSGVRTRLAAFAAAQVTPGELAALIQDTGLAAITLSRNPTHWVIFERAGACLEVVVTENGNRLRDVMDLAAR